MSAVAELWHQLNGQYLRQKLDQIGDEVGAPEQASPEQVLEAAQSLRERLNVLLGHRSTPRDLLGRRLPLRVVGR